MHIFVLALVAVIAVSAVNTQSTGETGGSVSNLYYPVSNKYCIPGNTIMENCDICRCDAKGIGYKCTRMACLKLPATTCEPGKNFNYYCNTCMCPPDGLRNHASCCTLKACFGIWTEDGTLVRPREPLAEPIP